FLMNVQELTVAERARIQGELSRKLDDADEVIRNTSRLLALTSHHMGLVEAPDQRNAEVCRVEMVPVGARRVGLVLVDNYGRVRTLVAKLDDEWSSERIQRIGRFLDTNFRGVSVEGLRAAVSARTSAFIDEQRRLAEQALHVLALMPPSRQGEVILEGTTHLFEQPEFRDLDRARQVFGFLEEHDRLVELLRSAMREGQPLRTSIVIGSEVPDAELHEISIVVAPYRVGDHPAGMVGVLGPRRMEYSRLAGLVEYTAALLGSYLSGIAGLMIENTSIEPLLDRPQQ
ncbi:MAG: HrcA family transcriptional regulator, partial [Candidatus Hydrogenedentota bacterium]